MQRRHFQFEQIKCSENYLKQNNNKKIRTTTGNDNNCND